MVGSTQATAIELSDDPFSDRNSKERAEPPSSRKRARAESESESDGRSALRAAGDAHSGTKKIVSARWAEEHGLLTPSTGRREDVGIHPSSVWPPPLHAEAMRLYCSGTGDDYVWLCWGDALHERILTATRILWNVAVDCKCYERGVCVQLHGVMAATQPKLKAGTLQLARRLIYLALLRAGGRLSVDGFRLLCSAAMAAAYAFTGSRNEIPEPDCVVKAIDDAGDYRISFSPYARGWCETVPVVKSNHSDQRGRKRQLLGDEPLIWNERGMGTVACIADTAYEIKTYGPSYSPKDFRSALLDLTANSCFADVAALEETFPCAASGGPFLQTLESGATCDAALIARLHELYPLGRWESEED